MKLLIYDQLKRSITHLVQTFKLNLSAAPTGRPRKIPPIDALTLALYQHRSTRATKRSVYEDLKSSLHCSYKTLVVSINKVAVLAAQLLALLMRSGAPTSHPIKYTDATDLPVCLKKNMDEHKTMAGLASMGKSTKGWYYGLKMTMTRDDRGTILGLKFSDAGTNDRDLFRQINKGLMGILVADAGYVSSELERDMFIEGQRWVLIRPKRNMKKLATAWQLAVYRGRFKIEFDFRSLKLFHGLVTSLPRSVNGYLANYLHAVLAFVIA